MSIIKAETRNQETWVRTNDFVLNASANVVSLNISIVPSIHLFQDEYRNISFIPELTSRLDSTVNVFIQIRLYATRTFQRICKKKRKEKKEKKRKEEKQVLKVYEKYQATSELWSCENADALVQPPSILFSGFHSLWDLWSGISKD